MIKVLDKIFKKNKFLFLTIVILILCVLIYLQKEGFHNPFYDPFYNPFYNQFYEHHYDPIYGYPTRVYYPSHVYYPSRIYYPTRNMSYDLRGDPNVYYTVRIGPWGESVILPQYRFREPLEI